MHGTCLKISNRILTSAEYGNWSQYSINNKLWRLFKNYDISVRSRFSYYFFLSNFLTHYLSYEEKLANPTPTQSEINLKYPDLKRINWAILLSLDKIKSLGFTKWGRKKMIFAKVVTGIQNMFPEDSFLQCGTSEEGEDITMIKINYLVSNCQNLYERWLANPDMDSLKSINILEYVSNRLTVIYKIIFPVADLLNCFG